MYTTIDKALTAVVLGTISILNLMHWLPAAIVVDDSIAQNISAVIALLTPVAVYLVPNKKA